MSKDLDSEVLFYKGIQKDYNKIYKQYKKS